MSAAPRGLWVFIDQGVVSLANFAAPVLVGRYGGQEQLGYYTLGLSIYLFAYALARSVVWTAYTKNLPHLAAPERAAFTGSATAHMGLFALASAGVIALVAAAAAALGSPQLATLMLVLAPVSAAMLFREHVRRVGLARLEFFRVLAFDTIVAVVQVGLLCWLASEGRMTASMAFAGLAVAALLSVVWLVRDRANLRLDRARVKPDWRMNWAISKWLAPAATAATLGNQGYRWMLPALTSVGELGRLGAAQVVVQFTNPVVIGLSNFLGPTTAKILADEGVRGLWRYTCRVSLIMLAGVAAFLAMVALVGKPFVVLLMGDAASGVTTTLLVTLCAGVLSEAMLIPIQSATVNLGRGQLLFKTAVIRLAVNVTLGFGLVGVFGAEAIGLGMLAGSLISMAWQWAVFAAEVRDA